VIDWEEMTDTNTNTAHKLSTFIGWCWAEWKLPIWIYSSMRFYQNYPAVVNLVGQPTDPWDSYMAQWIWSNKDAGGDWANLVNFYPKEGQKVYTPGYAQWVFWQWAVFKNLPGINGEVDLNFFNGDRAQLHSYLNYTPHGSNTPPEEPGGGGTQPPGRTGWWNTASS
jgi:hypothetical protein